MTLLYPPPVGVTTSYWQEGCSTCIPTRKYTPSLTPTMKTAGHKGTSVLLF